ncbi:MAG: ABC transporter ATP-binding protein [Propionibacteriaceae bacterium]
MTATLRLQDVSRIYGVGDLAVPALRNVSIEVQPGEFIAVMGASGSGKSTLLATAGGLDTGGSGEVYVCGKSMSGLSKNAIAQLRRRHIGYVFQDYNLVPTLSVVENVALPLELDKIKPRKARQTALVALQQVDMAELADRRLDQISGGQRQRVAIARAIVGERKLVLADEPTGALDSVSGDGIMKVLRELTDSGISVVLVTHEARHAGWADRVIFLRDGRIVDESAVDSRVDSLLSSSL